MGKSIFDSIMGYDSSAPPEEHIDVETLVLAAEEAIKATLDLQSDSETARTMVKDIRECIKLHDELISIRFGVEQGDFYLYRTLLNKDDAFFRFNEGQAGLENATPDAAVITAALEAINQKVLAKLIQLILGALAFIVTILIGKSVMGYNAAADSFNKSQAKWEEAARSTTIKETVIKYVSDKPVYPLDVSSKELQSFIDVAHKDIPNMLDGVLLVIKDTVLNFDKSSAADHSEKIVKSFKENFVQLIGKKLTYMQIDTGSGMDAIVIRIDTDKLPNPIPEDRYNSLGMLNIAHNQGLASDALKQLAAVMTKYEPSLKQALSSVQKLEKSSMLGDSQADDIGMAAKNLKAGAVVITGALQLLKSFGRYVGIFSPKISYKAEQKEHKL